MADMTTELSENDLLSIYQFTKGLARRAGAMIVEGSAAVRHQTVNEKKNAVDLVTEWDVKVEGMVRQEIAAVYPEFKFIGEESYSSGETPALTDAPTFCVDPIDGTTNFVHGFPFSCISLGLIYKKRPVMGVIYNPFLDQLYSALKSHGAFLNETIRLPIHPASSFPSLSTALIGVEWGSDRSKSVVEKKASSFMRLAGDPSRGPDEGVKGGKMVHSMRSIGSAALNYTLVAAGNLDLYWEIGCWSWDVCAGIVIAQEAGGFVSGAPGSSLENDVTETILLGRKYIVVRNVADTPSETGLDAQRRIVKEFYDTVEDWSPN